MELDKAKRAGTIAALDDFARRYPNHGMSADLKAARHALYARALASWKTKASPDAATAAFVERLLAQAEGAGSAAAEVRFRPLPSKSMDDADKNITKSTHYPGPDALPSRYFTTEALRRREDRVSDDLVKGLAAELPPDVLALRAGEPLAPDASPAKDVPTLVIEYSPEWSRVDAVSLKPPTIFAGFNFAFEASFILADGAPLQLKVKAWRGAELWKLKGDGIERTEFEQQVYDTMIDGAFDQLDKRLLDVFVQ